MEIRIINKYLAIVLVCVGYAFSYGSCDLTLFDVGQGNCSLVKCTDKSVLMIDCGSSSNIFKGKKFKNVMIDEIAKKATALYRQSPVTEFCLIISHPDKDHYNWTIGVLKKCELLMRGDRKFHVNLVYLGGSESDYNAKFITFLKNGKTKIVYPTAAGKTKTVTCLCDSAGAYELLPALPCKKKDESNDSSLVIRISHGTKSCIITGDATGKTTEHIMKHCSRAGYSLMSDIALASHHGAEDEECNSSNWIAAINPQYVIFSAGVHEGYLHPRTAIVNRHQDYTATRSYHILHTGVKKRSDDVAATHIYGLNPEHYGIIATASNVLSTLSQGSIAFSWITGDTVLSVPSCSNGEFFETEKECVLHCSLNPHATLQSCFALDKMASLNFSNLGIDDTDNKDREYMCKLLALLIEKNSVLKKFLFNNNRFSTAQTIGLLKDLIQKTHIRTFEVENCDIPSTDIHALKKTWDNRGFKG